MHRASGGAGEEIGWVLPLHQNLNEVFANKTDLALEIDAMMLCNEVELVKHQRPEGAPLV